MVLPLMVFTKIWMLLLSTTLDVVVAQRAAVVLKLLAPEDQALLVRRDAELLLDLHLDIAKGGVLPPHHGDGLESVDVLHI